MKKFQLPLAIALTFATGTSAFAEEYYVPIKKELEPMARIALSSYTMDNNKVTYTLPRDITGKTIQIEAIVQNYGDITVPRIYKAPNATLACMGDNVLPACVVTHNNLGINKSEVSEFLTTKYRDPKKLSDAIAVADQFSSSSDPIGIISKRTLLAPKAVPLVWRVNLTRFADDATVTNNMEAKFDLIAGNFAETVYRGNYAVTKEVVQDDLHWSGILEFVSGERRWFDMGVSTDKAVLTGTWGYFDQQGKSLQAQGAIKGKEF